MAGPGIKKGVSRELDLKALRVEKRSDSIGFGPGGFSDQALPGLLDIGSNGTRVTDCSIGFGF